MASMATANSQTRVTSRTKLLATAADLFYSRGINATGIDTVIAQAGVAKGSMYHYFSSKEALIAAYLDEESDAWLARVTKVDVPSEAPAERVSRLFLALAEQVDAGTFYGCPFTNAAIECPDMPDVRAAIARYRRVLHDHISDLLASRADEPLIATVTVLYDGALTSAKLTGESGRVRDVAIFVRELLASKP
jgi:AcrR family transcriptional regulator